MNTKSSQHSHIVMLFFAALFWGTTFVAQRIGADSVDAWTYLALRSWVAVIFLTPVVHAFDRLHDRRGTDNRRPRTPESRRLLLLAGVMSGCALCAASVTQQIGIAYTTASKAGFLTALYVVFVPLLAIFVKKKPSPKIWGCVALALVGMYLLCMTSESFRLEAGDAWELLCAVLFGAEIILLDHFSPLVDGVRLSRLQFLVIAVISTVVMFFNGLPSAEALKAGLPAIAYAGVFSSGIAYTLQILGQDGVNPTVACLVMSLESVFSALTAWIVLHERMSPRELFGCVLIFAAIVFAQIDFRPEREREGTP